MSPRAAWRLESLGFTAVYEYPAGKMDWLAFGLPTEGTAAGVPRAANVLRRDAPTCRLDERLGDVRPRVQGAGWSVCGVVNDANVLLGLLRGKAWDAPDDEPVEQVMSEGPTTIRPSQDLEDIAGRMVKRKVSALFVTSSDGRLIGLLRRDDAVGALGSGKSEMGNRG